MRKVGLIPLFLFLFACGGVTSSPSPDSADLQVVEAGRFEDLVLPPPFATPRVPNRPKVIGWPGDQVPRAPEGFEVRLFAGGLQNPRSLYVFENGDVAVAESDRIDNRAAGPSANRVTLLRDADGDGRAEVKEILIEGLNQPFGMTCVDGFFYVANTDGLVRYPYRLGDEKIASEPESVLPLPAGGQHWTRSVISSLDGSKLYVSVGSSSSYDADGLDINEPRRAAILEANPGGSEMRVYAGGLRNATGLDWEPETGRLWAVVMERGGLGDQLPPDVFTRIREGGFYGWPYYYLGKYPEPRLERKPPADLPESTLPDYAMPAHSSPLALHFYRDELFPNEYRGGAFIAMHGSVSRSHLVGYKVWFVPFEEGRPAGLGRDFLTGFIADPATSEVFGRPAGLAAAADGSLLLADDAGNSVWRVSPEVPAGREGIGADGPDRHP